MEKRGEKNGEFASSAMFTRGKIEAIVRSRDREFVDGYTCFEQHAQARIQTKIIITPIPEKRFDLSSEKILSSPATRLFTPAL